MSAMWQHSDFETLVGEPVSLRALDGIGADREVAATVTACSDAVRIGDLVSYKVTLTAGSGAPREQAVFLVEASGRQAQPVFLVPVRAVADGIEYEAVFNQSVDSRSGP